MHGEKMTTVSFQLNQADHKALKATARHRGVTQAALVRELIRRDYRRFKK